jgi:hypothetical protein
LLDAVTGGDDPDACRRLVTVHQMKARAGLAAAEIAEPFKELSEQRSLKRLKCSLEAEPEATAFGNGEVVVVEDAIGCAEPHGLVVAEFVCRTRRQPDRGRARSA